MFNTKNDSAVIAAIAVALLLFCLGLLTYRMVILPSIVQSYPDQQHVSPSSPDHYARQEVRNGKLCSIIQIDMVICSGQTNLYTNAPYLIEHTKHPVINTNR